MAGTINLKIHFPRYYQIHEYICVFLEIHALWAKKKKSHFCTAIKWDIFNTILHCDDALQLLNFSKIDCQYPIWYPLFCLSFSAKKCLPLLNDSTCNLLPSVTHYISDYEGMESGIEPLTRGYTGATNHRRIFRLWLSVRQIDFSRVFHSLHIKLLHQTKSSSNGA